MSPDEGIFRRSLRVPLKYAPARFTSPAMTLISRSCKLKLPEFFVSPLLVF